jgi:hypothetical protein
MTQSSGRIDNNQSEIVDKCRAAGMIVHIMSQYPKHPFDLLVGYRGTWIPFEVKRKKEEKLRPRQVAFKDKCEAKGLPIYTVTNFETVLSVFDGLEAK